MNMNGGYDTVEYTVLMAKHMEGEIKPFVNRFIAALNEYRENYAKPENTIGHKRADFYRQMLNKLTDDDTGGQPLGDLLLNQTKYEMGDAAYNALSDAEKKNHADILTLLMQANGRAVLLLETFIAKATDSSDDTWIDRFLEITTDDLKEQIKADHPQLTTNADVMAELDKTYNDTAKKIFEKWEAFQKAILAYNETANEVLNADLTISEDIETRLENLLTKKAKKEDFEAIDEVVDKRVTSVTTMLNTEELAVIDYLDSIDYEYGTMLEFFSRESYELTGEGIRDLYPIAAALSPGQIAGLDFLSLTDLFSMALVNEEGFNTLDIDHIEPASVYQDVDREIYEPGGVALTNKTLRKNAFKEDNDSGFSLSNLGIVFWSLTGVSALATLSSIVLDSVFFIKATNAAELYNFTILRTIPFWKQSADIAVLPEQVKLVSQKLAESNARADTALSSSTFFTKAGNLTYYLSIGLTVLTAVLSAVSIYLTISEMLAYYNVKFSPIPRYMVDELDITETVNGKTVMKKNETAYYKVVTCNRKEGSSDIEKANYSVLGNSNDLNGDVGKQWLALYTVKYEQGRPILADSLKFVTGTNGTKASALPAGYETGIHRFGEGSAFNLTSEFYCYKDKPNGTYVYFKNADKTVSEMTTRNSASILGSLFSNGSLMIGTGVGAVLGAGAAVLVMTAARKRKKEEIAA